jgi:hypothetical protein
MYLLLGSYGLYFLVGAAFGRFDTVKAFGAHFLNDTGPFLLIGRLIVVLAGVGVVWLSAAIARRVFRSTAAGITAGAIAAVMAPLVASSQEIKSDMPCAFLIALAVYLYIGIDAADDRDRSAGRRVLARAAFTGGVALGMHYYAVILLPAFALTDAVRLWQRRRRAAEIVGRLALLGAMFFAGFFVSSPFNVLDRDAGAYYTAKIAGAATPNARYEPDRSVSFKPGARTSLMALGSLADVLTRESALGWLLLVLIAAGMMAGARDPYARTLTLLVVAPSALFVAGAIVVFPFHAAPRHLTAILPLAATLVWPGARLLASAASSRPPVRTLAATAAVAVACAQAAVASVDANHERLRRDSRVVAYDWIVSNVPHDARLLLDDYGPALVPSPPAVNRMMARLDGLPPGPFTAHQSERLVLLRAYPSSISFNIDELGHQWWLPSEKTDVALRGTPADLDMGSPLVSRVPRRIDDYRRDGFRYIVTNSAGAGRYRREPDRFPSFARFYRELAAMTPIKTFDPAAWNGKGPVVWIYELDLAPPAVAGNGTR